MADVELYQSYFYRHPDVAASLAAWAMMFPMESVVAPAIMGGLVDKVKNGATFSSVKWRVLLILGIVGLLYTANILKQHANVELRTTFLMEARREIIRRLMQSRAYRFTSVDIPEVVYRLVEIPHAMVNVLNYIREIGPSAATMVGTIVYFAWISAKAKDPTIALVILFACISVWAIAGYNAETSLPELVDNTQRTEQLYNRFGDVLEVLPHTFAVAARTEETENQSEQVLSLLEQISDTYRHMVNIQTVSGGVMLTAVAISFALLWRAHKRGALGPGVFTGSIFVLMFSRSVMWNLVGMINPLLRELSEIRRLNVFFEELDREIEDTNAVARDSNNTTLDCVTPSLAFERVSFGYTAGATVLNDVSFELPANSRTLVQGPVGSGKSTVALLSIGLRSPTSGVVRLCGHDITSLGRKGISQLVSMVPAVPSLLDRTVRENMLFGLSDRGFTDEDLRQALFSVGVNISLDRRVGHRGEELSTGQRKLVYLAKAMLQDNPVLIVDELTANLDDETAAEVLRHLDTVARGKVLVFVSHDPPEGFRFDRTLTVSGGGINENFS